MTFICNIWYTRLIVRIGNSKNGNIKRTLFHFVSKPTGARAQTKITKYAVATYTKNKQMRKNPPLYCVSLLQIISCKLIQLCHESENEWEYTVCLHAKRENWNLRLLPNFKIIFNKCKEALMVIKFCKSKAVIRLQVIAVFYKKGKDNII